MNLPSKVSPIPKRLANSFSVPRISSAACSSFAEVEFTLRKRQPRGFGLVVHRAAGRLCRIQASCVTPHGYSSCEDAAGHVIAMARKPKNHLPARQPLRAQASEHLAILRDLSEVEGLMRPPLLPSQLERANGMALAIARNAPDAVIAMLGTRLVRAIEDARAAGESADIRPIALVVARIRAALDQPV